MRLTAALALLVACSAPGAQPQPTPAVAAPVAVVRIDPRDFTVGVAALPSGDETHVRRLILELPAAWHKATLGRSAVTIAPAASGVHDVTLLLSGERNAKADALTYGRAVVMFSGQISEARLVLSAVHELGHALGCCSGTGALDKHWTDCDAAPAQLMCPAPPTTMTTFSERELAQMGLAAR